MPESYHGLFPFDLPQFRLRATIPLDFSSVATLNSIALYNPYTHILTINPHEKLYLSADWNYKMDDGKWVNEIMPGFTQEKRSRLSWYFYHPSSQWNARLTAVIIKDRSATLADTTFVFRLQGIFGLSPD